MSYAQGWPLFLNCSAADLEILSAARFSAAGVLVLQRFAAAALRFTAAALRCSAKKHKRCSGSSKTQALQRYSSLLENFIEKAID